MTTALMLESSPDYRPTDLSLLIASFNPTTPRGLLAAGKGPTGNTRKQSRDQRRERARPRWPRHWWRRESYRSREIRAKEWSSGR